MELPLAFLMRGNKLLCDERRGVGGRLKDGSGPERTCSERTCARSFVGGIFLAEYRTARNQCPCSSFLEEGAAGWAAGSGSDDADGGRLAGRSGRNRGQDGWDKGRGCRSG